MYSVVHCNLLIIYNTVHITDYFQFIFSMLPPDFSNQPTKGKGVFKMTSFFRDKPLISGNTINRMCVVLSDDLQIRKTFNLI